MNISEIEISYNQRDGLLALGFGYNADGRRILIDKIKGEKVKKILDMINNEYILRSRQFINDDCEILKYDDLVIKVNNYKFIKKCGLLCEYHEKIMAYIAMKKGHVAPKVKRVNKHVDKKIIAGSMVLLTLLSTMIMAVHSMSNKVEMPDTGKDMGIYDVIETPESTIFDEIINNNSTVTPDVVVTPNVTVTPTIIPEISSPSPETTPSLTPDYEEVVKDYIYINHEDRSDYDKVKKTRELYGDIIDKYAKMYGLDTDLVIALATQERGVHSPTMDRGGATGLMQIQNGVWLNYTMTAYNLETGKRDSVKITKEALADCETNIQIGCMILQDYMKKANYNIILGLQYYNMGPSGTSIAVDRYAEAIGSSREEVMKNVNDCGWLDYRDGINGDKLYVERVLSYLGKEKICIYKTDGTPVECYVKLGTREKTR